MNSRSPLAGPLIGRDNSFDTFDLLAWLLYSGGREECVWIGAMDRAIKNGL
ncbi:hypothetical protein D3C74_105570 [compost metagenome]